MKLVKSSSGVVFVRVIYALNWLDTMTIVLIGIGTYLMIGRKETKAKAYMFIAKPKVHS